MSKRKFKPTKKQESFLLNLEEGMTERNAARAAGYAESSVAKGKFKRGKPIKQEMQETRSRMAKKYNITKDDVLEGMQSSIDQAESLEEPATRLRGYVEIAKLLGFYSPEIKVNLNINDLTPSELRQMKTEDLLDLIGSETLRDTRPIEGEYERLEGPDGGSEEDQSGEEEAEES